MQWGNTRTRFGAVTKSIHWVTAFIVIGLLAVGLVMTDMEVSPFKFELYWWHKSFGILVLALTAARLAWRLRNPVPEILGNPAPWEHRLARANHAVFYVFLLAQPIIGWLISSAADVPVNVFGLFLLPRLVEPDKELVGLFAEMHEITAWIIAAAIALHVAGALKHHAVNKDRTILRMLPFARGQEAGE